MNMSIIFLITNMSIIREYSYTKFLICLIDFEPPFNKSNTYETLHSKQINKRCKYEYLKFPY